MAFDAIIVGGGIIGCTSAYFLARKGLKVAVVEKADIAGGTTGSSFAWINATSKTSDEAYHRLNALGLEGYLKLAVEFGEEALGINPTGALEVVRSSDIAGHAALAAKAAALESFGYPSKLIGVSELRELEPHVAFDDDSHALYAMRDLCLDAPRFVRFMADQICNLGGEVREHCAAREILADDDGRVTAIVTDEGTFETPNVLVATGPGTPEVLSELTGYDGFAARFPMHRVPGLLVTTPATAPPGLVRRVIYFSSDADVHILPDFSGGLKLGADDTDGLAAGTDDPAILREAALKLLRRARERVPGSPGDACIDDCKIAIGVRPYPQDGKSLAGPLPRSHGLFIIATHSGVTLAPAIGSLIAEAIADGRALDTLKPFSLERYEAFN